ncbi:MAG: ATP-dependent DNA helicase RecG [Gammaproteobacteria bacterium]|nr:ATP-dependent DNA helicase RecG [Gammaproteobacteria bacterium]
MPAPTATSKRQKNSGTGGSLEKLPLTSLRGVGPGIEKKLNNLGIYNVQDLLFHLPFRYQDRTRLNDISKVKFGDHVQLEGELVASRVMFGKRRSLQCTLKDDSGFINLRFFYFTAAQKNALKPGVKLRCYGEVRRGSAGYEIYHPEYSLLDHLSDPSLQDTLTPIYPATEGLQQNRIRNIIDQALSRLERSDQVTEYLPAEVRAAFDSLSLAEAIRFLHHPPQNVTLELLESGQHPAQQRLAFEELLSHRLCMRKLRLAANNRAAPRMPPQQSLVEQFASNLPFSLTGAQQRAFQEIADDMSLPHPMLRLVQGDVGSGKTVVAALAALRAVENDFQVAIMAPTEILAEQHFINFTDWLEPLGVRVGWLSGKLSAGQRKAQQESIACGESRVIVGTHALFQESVSYANLGLIVIDEQHRFGVHQRMALKEKSASAAVEPHQLVMTATPIPRTLAMSAYADLDCSVIDELPPGRTPVTTLVIGDERRQEIIGKIRNACNEGNQVYWVCTLIEESESLQCQAAEATARTMREQLPELAIGLVHGRMKPKEKAQVMEQFKGGQLQLLVATTVIEVGVDVPNASLMVIENSERLGLAQLHQLRGRVGRGSKRSYCVLLYQNPLSETSKHRLAVMRESTDGFYIAEKDLEIRGPGQVLGTQQTGLMSFRVADISRDAHLLDDVREYSELILSSYPQLVESLVDRWLGKREDYGRV